jgi:hypothetical protein
MQEFDGLTALMDPSRNMKTYRQLLLNSPPPLIPFFRTRPHCMMAAPRPALTLAHTHSLA